MGQIVIIINIMMMMKVITINEIYEVIGSFTFFADATDFTVSLEQ